MSRTAIALPLGLLGFFAYLVAVLALADAVLAWHWALQVPFFLLAGVAWAWPAYRLVLWSAHK